MAFRDDLDAARLRSEKLSRDLEALRSSSEANAAETQRLERELAGSRREVDRLRAHEPGSASQRRSPYRTVLFVALGLAIATAVAGYHSETLGMTMSYFAAALLGAGVAGWIGAGRSRVAGAVSAAAGVMLALGALFVFYEGVWPAL